MLRWALGFHLGIQISNVEMGIVHSICVLRFRIYIRPSYIPAQHSNLEDFSCTVVHRICFCTFKCGDAAKRTEHYVDVENEIAFSTAKDY